MGFYPFSKHSTINLCFVAQSIRLGNRGRFEIVSDLLIENTGSTEINSIDIIYPYTFDSAAIEINNLLYKSEYKALSRKEERRIATLSFRTDHENIPDISWQLALDNIPENIRYLCYNSKPEIRNLGPTNFQVTIPIPQFNNPINFTNHVGDLLNVDKDNKTSENKFYINASLTIEERILLASNNFSIVNYFFKTPLKCNQKRWLRFALPSYPSTIIPITLSKSVLLYIIGELKYCFEIYSPFDILHRFSSKFYIGNIGNYLGGRPRSDIIGDDFGNITGILEYLDDINNMTTINEHRLHIFPQSFRLLHDLYLFSPSNNIIPLGTYPNHERLLVEKLIDIEENFFLKAWNIIVGHKYKSYDWIYLPRLDDLVSSSISPRTLDSLIGFRMFFKTKFKSFRLKFVKVIGIILLLGYLFKDCLFSLYNNIFNQFVFIKTYSQAFIWGLSLLPFVIAFITWINKGRLINLLKKIFRGWHYG